MNAIYLDHAAATPVDSRVMAAMLPYFEQQFYNPSALYNAAEQVRRDIETSRASVAKHLGARPAEIVFTAGGTEANNLAINGVMRHYPGARVAVSAIEHDSVLQTAMQFEHDIIAVDELGIVTVDAVTAALTDQTVLISVMYANNEIGTIQSIREIGQLIDTERRARRAAGNKLPLYLHSDAAQATNYLDLQVTRLGVDMMTLNGGKMPRSV